MDGDLTAARFSPLLLLLDVSVSSGVVSVCEASVLIAVSSPHRRESLEAVSWCIDELKRVLCVWKKEWYADGSVWKQNAEWDKNGLATQQTTAATQAQQQ